MSRFTQFVVSASSVAAVAATGFVTAGSASASTLTLHEGDTFTTANSGVVCQVEKGGAIDCMTTTARVASMTNAKARATCGPTALQGVTVDRARWSWLCGTGMTVYPTARTNAWATSHHLAIGARTHAAVIPAGWIFTTGAVNGHVSRDGSLTLTSAKNGANSMTANGRTLSTHGV